MDLKTYLEAGYQTQTGLARKLGVSQGLVYQWITGRTQITGERAIAIERATGGLVSRYELRPDLFFEGPAFERPAEERENHPKALA